MKKVNTKTVKVTLTKEELKAEHKWRMKNDMEYKHQQAVLKAAKSKGTQAGHAVTDGDNHTRPVRGRGGSMGAVGRIGGDFLDQTK